MILDRLRNLHSANGLLLSDDIEDNLAFRDFAVRAGREPLVLAKAADNFAGLLKK